MPAVVAPGLEVVGNADHLEADLLGLARVLEQRDRVELLGRGLVAEFHAATGTVEPAQDRVERVALRSRAARRMRRPDQVRGLELHAVVGPGQPADRFLHERAAEVVDAPVERLGGGVETHLHPARLQVRDRPPEREPERRRVPQVVLARDLLDPVSASQHRVERDERERNELGEAAGALLKLAHHTHVLGQLPGLLDVAEHHRHGGAHVRGVGGLDDLHPARDRQLVR